MKTQVMHIYKPDGTQEIVYPAKGRKFQLSELQKGVGGFIESLVPGVPNCKQMYCNEEAVLRNLPANPFTWSLVNKKVYEINNYPPEWRVQGNIIVILNEEIFPPDTEKK